MHQYFDDEIVKTYTLQDYNELNCVLEINANHCNFNVIHRNIRSISKTFDEFRLVLTNIKTKIDCVVLKDTWSVPYTDISNIDGMI